MALTSTAGPPRAVRRTATAGLVPLGAAAGWLIRHRSSRAVRCWRLGDGTHRIAGELSVRAMGDGDRAVILLHGLTASGDYFGAEYDRLADHAQLVIPDLLGFGRSLDEPRRPGPHGARTAARRATS